MTPQDEQIIAQAREMHVCEFHEGAFETCQDAGCKAAQWVKESAQGYQEVEAQP